ncbi:MFS transporter [Micromonospora sp. CPCC 205371]|nr:MFS transporter [Micromonospora sp. CPCC 205371]
MKRGLVGLFVAKAISAVGTKMSFLAVPWFVLVTSDSAARTGFVAFAEMLPYVLVCAFGGPLLDRMGARRIGVIADLGSALAVAAIPILHRGPGLSFPVLVALVAVLGLLRGFGDSAKRVLLPRAVAVSGVPMTRATSIQDGIYRLATLLGAPLAGVLIAVLDAPTVLLVDAATFFISSVLVGSLVPRAEKVGGEPYLRALKAGWGFLRRDRLILGVALMIFMTNLLDQAYAAVLMPVWGRDVVGSVAAVGLLWGLFGAGAVAGNAVFTVLAPKLPRYTTFAVGFLIAGAPRFVVPALTDEVWVVCAVAVVSGFAIAGVNPVLGAAQYERVPKEMHARVLGASMAISWGGIPLGGLIGGWMVEELGLNAAFWIFGAVYLATTVTPFLLPFWKEIDHPASTGESHEDAEQDEGHSGDREDDQQVTPAIAGGGGGGGRRLGG